MVKIICNLFVTQLLTSGDDPASQSEIDLLTLLIESYDKQQHYPGETDPVDLLRSFMNDHKLAPDQLASTLNISNGHMSAILSHKRRVSKLLARKLAKHFKVRSEAFEIPYLPNKVHFVIEHQAISEFRVLIRQARFGLNMTQQQLADKCGIARYYISKAENDSENVSVSILRTIVEKGFGGQFRIAFEF